MLDAIRGLAGGGKAQKQAEELEALIATARKERGALNAMVDAVTTQSAKLTETGKSLEQVNAKAVAATGSLDAVAKRLEELERKAGALVDIEKKAQGLDATISQIQELATEKASAQVAAVHGDLEQLRSIAGQLGQDCAKIRDTSRDAREDSAVAVTAVKEVENKLGRLTQLQELSKATDEKLTAINALAEHVNQKTKVLDGQKHIVDRAVVEANRVNELVWNVDVQIGKLNEGLGSGLWVASLAREPQRRGTGNHQPLTNLQSCAGRQVVRFRKVDPSHLQLPGNRHQCFALLDRVPVERRKLVRVCLGEMRADDVTRPPGHLEMVVGGTDRGQPPA